MPESKILMRVPQSRERRAAARMTGRYLMTLSEGGHQEITAKLTEAGFRAATPLSRDATRAHSVPRGHQMVLPNASVAIVDPAPEQEETLFRLTEQEQAVDRLEPERIVRAVEQTDPVSYIRGWREGTDALATKLIQENQPSGPQLEAAATTVTWGLVITKVLSDRSSGQNIKVAILDTGFDLSHPDFRGRRIITKNFVGDDSQFHDGVGHGTHCIGTACGPIKPTEGPRYGIAYQAQIFAGRVLDDTGHGGDFNVIQGIDWAIENLCDIVSLSLGTPWLPGDPPFSPAYERAAQKALAAGCVLVVAAGNEADDPRFVGAVGTPGNSPSVLTVAAVDRTLATAAFSDRVQSDAPGVKGPDLAGPGVGIYSAWPVAAGQYNSISGTSMATPHVAGIAALYAEANPGVRGQALKDLLRNRCSRLGDGERRRGEIGRGVVQAPTESRERR
jgi:subtilisin family serine protease